MTYHVQKPGTTLKTYCGRRVGTPGGKIYPGVHAELPEWFATHQFPEVVEEVTCRACKKAREREVAKS